MATEDDLRDAQVALLRAQLQNTWTPSVLDVARLVCQRLDDKYSGTTKPNIEMVTDEVIAVLRAVHVRLVAPGMWAAVTQQAT